MLPIMCPRGTKHAAPDAHVNIIPTKMKNLTPMRLVSGVLRLIPLLLLTNLAHGTTYNFTTTYAPEGVGNPSLGTGWAYVSYDDVAQTMQVTTAFSGLLAGVTAAHIHGPTAVANAGTAAVATQVPTFDGFPSGVTAGSYDHIFDMTLASSFRAGFITANGGTTASASAALLAAMLEEKTYLNIHTTAFPGGEIRGFLHLASVPDQGATLLLLSIGLGAMAAIARRQKIGA